MSDIVSIAAALAAASAALTFAVSALAAGFRLNRLALPASQTDSFEERAPEEHGVLGKRSQPSVVVAGSKKRVKSDHRADIDDLILQFPTSFTLLRAMRKNSLRRIRNLQREGKIASLLPCLLIIVCADFRLVLLICVSSCFALALRREFVQSLFIAFFAG